MLLPLLLCRIEILAFSKSFSNIVCFTNDIKLIEVDAIAISRSPLAECSTLSHNLALTLTRARTTSRRGDWMNENNMNASAKCQRCLCRSFVNFMFRFFFSPHIHTSISASFAPPPLPPPHDALPIYIVVFSIGVRRLSAPKSQCRACGLRRQRGNACGWRKFNATHKSYRVWIS